MPSHSSRAANMVLLGLPLYSSRLVREATLSFHKRPIVCSPAQLYDLLKPYYQDRDREELVAVLLDTGNSVIGCAQLSVGTRNSALFEPAALFRAAILAGADSVVLFHNHPSGNVEPSRDDVVCARQARRAGQIIGIPVSDHLVIGDGFTSLAQRELM